LKELVSCHDLLICSLVLVNRGWIIKTCWCISKSWEHC